MQQNQIDKVKQCPVFELFNFMQDLRHLMIFDARDKEIIKNSPHIRGSYQINNQESQLKDFIRYQEDKIKQAQQQEQKYNQKPIRRAVFYHSEDISSNPEIQESLKKFIEILKQQDSSFRIYYLKEGFEQFNRKYPFLCLTFNDLDQYRTMKSVVKPDKQGEQQQQENEQQIQENKSKNNREDLLTQVQKKVLFSHSQFPVEVYENQLYLGSIHHINAEQYLISLNIKTVIDFTFEHSEIFKKKIEEKIKPSYDYQHIPLEKNKMGVELDFNEVNEYIENQIEKGKGPVFMFCKDGNAISPNFAIAYLMYQKNLQLQIASMKVFQYKAGVMDTCKNVYTQLMQYKPKK